MHRVSLSCSLCGARNQRSVCHFLFKAVRQGALISDGTEFAQPLTHTHTHTLWSAAGSSMCECTFCFLRNTAVGRVYTAAPPMAAPCANTAPLPIWPYEALTAPSVIPTATSTTGSTCAREGVHYGVTHTLGCVCVSSNESLVKPVGSYRCHGVNLSLQRKLWIFWHGWCFTRLQQLLTRGCVCAAPPACA